MSELKGLRVKDAVEGRVLTTDSNGVMQSSNKSVDELATNSDISALDDRITALEGSVDELQDKVIDINGEEV